MHNFAPSNITAPSLEATDLEDLLNYLKHCQQTDFTGYKRSHLMRRIQVRMQQVGAQHYQEYIDRLTQQPSEVSHLLDTIFINYTSFFRDRPVWDCLKNDVLPKLIASKAPNEPIRVWSAACASGEETYSLAILLAEALGIEQFQQRVRIYGTDIDAEAIMQARRGRYSPQAVEEIPPDLLERYFECKTDGYHWRREIYGSIIFHRHNLTQFAPLPQIDLLACRNMLIYLTVEAQIRALVRFHFSLQQQGLLLLGQSENLVNPSQKSFFRLTNPQARIFTKEPTAKCDRRLLPIAFCRPSAKDGLTDEPSVKYPVSSASHY